MSIVQTLLVFVGIPALVFGLLAALVLAPGAARTPRYRPGEAWSFEPVWYVPQPERKAAAPAGAAHGALAAGRPAPALTAAPQDAAGRDVATQAAGPREVAAPVRTARGGVHETW